MADKKSKDNGCLYYCAPLWRNSAQLGFVFLHDFVPGLRRETWGTLICLLLRQLFGEEVGHQVVGFEGLGEFGAVPEGVGQGVVNDQAGVVTCVQEGSVEVGCAAQEQV